MVEHVQIIAVAEIRVKKPLKISDRVRDRCIEPPVKHPPRVFGVRLRIEPGTHVEQHAAASLLPLAGLGKLKAQLRLANSGGSHDHGQRARQDASSQQLVQSRDPARQSPVRGGTVHASQPGNEAVARRPAPRDRVSSKRWVKVRGFH